jgi:glycosyltransferase involved in cell wall biosynthesis
MLVVLLGWSNGLPCGVSDYTRRLAEALEQIGVGVLLPDWARWDVRKVSAYSAHLALANPDIVHLQYPASAYRLSIAPLLVFRSARCARVVTMHEWIASHPIRRLASAVLIRTADFTILTNERDRKALLAAWKRRLAEERTTVIPIGNNLLSSSRVASFGARRNEVVYFGLIRPGKGLESFLEVARRAAVAAEGLHFVVIGRVPAHCRGYARMLQKRASALQNVTWLGDLPEERAYSRMSEAKVAYLPYADGVSERHGSFAAALSAGLAVVSTAGSETTPELGRLFVSACDEERALEAIRHLIQSEGDRGELVKRAEQWLSKRSWEKIAESHLRIYEALRCDGRRGER